MTKEKETATSRGPRTVIVSSFIFWLSSVLHYLGTRKPETGGNPVAVLASVPVLLMALIGLAGSLAYLTVWPFLQARQGPRPRDLVLYLAGLILGFVLWELLFLDRLAYLQMLGTLTAAGIIALILNEKGSST